MKVDVLTVESIEIKKYRWWSNWVDVCVFDYGGSGYLLQMKVSRFNAKKFKCIAMKNLTSIAHANAFKTGNLTQMVADQ